MHLTHHAEDRIQQRGINELQLDWLLSYGRIGYNKGVCLYFFDQDGFEQLLNEASPDQLALAKRSREIYAVVAGPTVITIGYRNERFKSQKPHKRIRRGTPINHAARRIHAKTN